MRDTIIGRGRPLLACYLVGALLALAGLIVRVSAIAIGYRVGATSLRGDNKEWTPVFADVGLLVAGFGMAMVLLAMHHHLSAPPVASASGGGFEPVNIGGTSSR